jgi:hypothetical protein
MKPGHIKALRMLANEALAQSGSAYVEIGADTLAALLAALEQHEQSVRAAKLAGWRAGVQAERSWWFESTTIADLDERSRRLNDFYYADGGVAEEYLLLEHAASIHAPTPSELDPIQ